MLMKGMKGLALLAAGVIAGTAAHGQPGLEKSAFSVDLDALYGALQSSYGAPFATGADLDGSDGPDATQTNMAEFNALAGDDEDEEHEEVHDGWIDNFVTARNILRTETGLSNAVIDDIAEWIGVFMVIQGPGMEAAVDDFWTNSLGITDPAFSSIEWVHAHVFGGEGEGEEHEHEEEEGGGISHGGIFEVGDALFLTIPGDVDEGQAIQWFKDGAPLSDLGGIRLGTQERTLEIYYLELSDTGYYTATYDNGAKAAASFGPVSITVVDAGGLPVATFAGLGVLAVAMAGAGAVALRRKR